MEIIGTSAKWFMSFFSQHKVNPNGCLCTSDWLWLEYVHENISSRISLHLWMYFRAAGHTLLDDAFTRINHSLNYQSKRSFWAFACVTVGFSTPQLSTSCSLPYRAPASRSETDTRNNLVQEKKNVRTNKRQAAEKFKALVEVTLDGWTWWADLWRTEASPGQKILTLISDINHPKTRLSREARRRKMLLEVAIFDWFRMWWVTQVKFKSSRSHDTDDLRYYNHR